MTTTTEKMRADLVGLVGLMRAKQREFFASRSRSALQESKRLEKQVDALVTKIESGQADLFDREIVHDADPDLTDLTPNTYGRLLVLDLHDCDTSLFTRPAIEQYLAELCDRIGMTRCDLHFWDDEGVAPENRQTSPRTIGVSAVQFILTSSVTMHLLPFDNSEQPSRAFIDIFSCKAFDGVIAARWSAAYFRGTIAKAVVLERL